MVMTPTRAPTVAGQPPHRPWPRLYPARMNEDHTLVTVAEAAAQLGISPETLRTAARVGTLKVEKFSPRLNLVTPEAIEAYRRTHLGRQGRPKGARNKPKTPARTEGTVNAADVEPLREDRGGIRRAQKRRVPPSEPTNMEQEQPLEPTKPRRPS